MQRILMLLMCVSGCAFGGLRLAARLQGRAAALKDMRTGIRALLSAVSHTNRSLERIAADIGAHGGCHFWQVFAEGLKTGTGAYNAWCTALERTGERGGCLAALTGKDRALLNSFAITLGKIDRRTQTETGQLTLEALDAAIEGADELYAKKGRVYRVLGLFLGLGLGIFLW